MCITVERRGERKAFLNSTQPVHHSREKRRNKNILNSTQHVHHSREKRRKERIYKINSALASQ